MHKFASLALLVLLGFCCVSCGSISIDGHSVAGSYRYVLGLNYGGTLLLRTDGSYVWATSLTFCTPTIVENEDGSTAEVMDGWTNREIGRWAMQGQSVLLFRESRKIENENCESENFDWSREIVANRDMQGRISLVFRGLQRMRIRAGTTGDLIVERRPIEDGEDKE
jgi:hypothetical protein